MPTKVNYEDWWKQYAEINRWDPGTRLRVKIILNYLRQYNGKKLLDLGCGSGELLVDIHKNFPDMNLYGADVSAEALKILKKKVSSVNTMRIDLERDKKIIGKYDIVICSEVIEHLKNWRNALKIIADGLNKNGYAIISTQSGKIFPHHRKIGHIQHFELQEICSELKDRDLKILEAKAIGWPFMNLKNYIVTHGLKGDSYSNGQIPVTGKIAMKAFYYLYQLSLKKNGPQLFIVAQKNRD